MRFSSNVIYLGLAEKEFNGEKYKVCGVTDTDIMKTYTTGYDKDLELELSTLPTNCYVTFEFQLDRRIANNREMFTLKIVGVKDYEN